MNKYEFLQFEETPEAKHFGIAHIRYDGKFVLKFKVVHNKDGSGFFVAPPSYKREFPEGDKWSQWFFMDSRSEEEYIQDFIRANVNAIINKATGGHQSQNIAPQRVNPPQQQQNRYQEQANHQQQAWQPNEECPF